LKTKDFIEKIRQNVSTNGENTAELVEMTTSILSKILSEGDSVAIKGFGSLEVKKKEERVSVNPSTGHRWMIPPKLVPCYKPGTTIKEKLKNYSENE
jgi:DNA-binding protein HU-beta